MPTNISTTERWVNTRDLSEITGLTKVTIRELVKRGAIPVLRISTTCQRYCVDDVKAALQRRAKAPGSSD